MKEIITGKNLTEAVCTASQGNPPKQTVDFDEFAKANPVLDVDENFYGDEGFDSDEIDEEGFGMEGGEGGDTVSLDSIDDLY